MAVGREGEAIGEYEAAARLRPRWPAPRVNLAWLLATTDDPALVDGPRAIQLAEEALALAPEDANTLDTLAAAGDYQDAVATARQAVRRAYADGHRGRAAIYARRGRLYATGRRLVEPREPPAPNG